MSYGVIRQCDFTARRMELVTPTMSFFPLTQVHGDYVKLLLPPAHRRWRHTPALSYQTLGVFLVARPTNSRLMITSQININYIRIATTPGVFPFYYTTKGLSTCGWIYWYNWTNVPHQAPTTILCGLRTSYQCTLDVSINRDEHGVLVSFVHIFSHACQ